MMGRVPETPRSTIVIATFTTLADGLTTDFDVIELLQFLAEQCSALFAGADVGIMLKESDDSIQVIASSSGRARVTDTLELAAGEGPCIEAIETGVVITAASREELLERWPAFAARTEEVGYDATHAIPLKLRETVIGSLNFFLHEPGMLSDSDAELAQAFADVATITVMQHRKLLTTETVRAQLQQALTRRILIEQAKGMLSAQNSSTTDEAFELLRRHARDNNIQLGAVAQAVIDRSLQLSD
jgi:transcriptional regulator with GAF, ATPase, and Fis domain